MKMRKLGDSGLEVAPLALGGNVFGWTVQDATAFRLLDRFVDAGFNMIDTADIYSKWVPGNSGGESETILGRWFKRSAKRNKVLLATKVGMEMGPGRKGLSRDYILRAVEDSLRRLQIDCIDLYQSHADDPETPMEETLEAYGQLINQGKVKVIGASNFGAERLAQSLHASQQHGYPRYESLQPHYNLYERAAYEAELEAVCRDNNLAVFPYFSLGSGFLTGKYRSEADLSQSARGAGLKKYLNDRGFRILAALDQVSAEHATSPAQVSLAWLMARPGITAPIASATSVDQLNQLIEAATLKLDPASIAVLNQASD
jgi:aryl-alcohol dehydrogenase-like predicted oxidoreductase